MTGQPADEIEFSPKPVPLKNTSMAEAVIAFGKFNPPHAGHARLVEEVRFLACEGQPIEKYHAVFLSKGKGLLEYNQKLSLCREAFGKDIVVDSPHTNIFSLLEEIQGRFKKITLVVGTDRYQEFKERLGLYFENVEVVEFEREGESSTALRQAAQDGDLEAFRAMLPLELQEDAEEVFETVTAAQRTIRTSKLKKWSPDQDTSKKPSNKMRAMDLAKRIVRTRIAAENGRYYQDLTPSEKLQLDKKMATNTAAIQKIAQRLLPSVKRVEFRQLQSFTKGAPLQNLAVKEDLEIDTETVISKVKKQVKSNKTSDKVRNIMSRKHHANFILHGDDE